MHLILALSVIILQHIDSCSCRSIIRTSDRQAKSIEDSDSYELKNEDIAELLQPFLQPTLTENQQVQKNLAKLTIEPYLHRNQTKQQWQRNPYSRLNERKKTIAPLAIILANLPDLKFKQARDKVVKKTIVIKKDDENKLLSGSEDVAAPSDSPLKTKYDPIKSNSENLSSEEIIDVDTSTVVTIHSETETIKSNQQPYSVSWNDSEIYTESSGTSTEMSTRPDDLLSVVDEDSSYFENNERDAKNVRNEETFIPNHYTTEGSPSEKDNLLEIEEISKDFGLIVRDSAKEGKSHSQENEVENVVIKMLSEEPNASTEDNELNREENLHNQDIKETDKEIFDPVPENASFRLEIIKASTETTEHPPIKSNQDHIVVESNEEQSENHKNENSYESRDQIVIEVDNETIKDAIDNSVDDNKKYPHNFQGQIVKEAEEKPSKENIYENLLISHLKNSYGSQSELALNTVENSPMSHQMPIHSSHEIHTENELCNHKVHGVHRFHTHQTYNLSFLFNR